MSKFWCHINVSCHHIRVGKTNNVSVPGLQSWSNDKRVNAFLLMQTARPRIGEIIRESQCGQIEAKRLRAGSAEFVEPHRRWWFVGYVDADTSIESGYPIAN